jgi:phosphoglycerol transferase MdoB-like AlkP superfamily enzyme
MKIYRASFILICIFSILTFSYMTEVRNFGIFLVIFLYLLIYFVLRVFFIGPLLSISASTISILLIYVISKFKFRMMSRRLHPFDLYQYANFDSLRYAEVLYPGSILIFSFCFAALLAIIALFIWKEGFVRPSIRIYSAAGFVVAGGFGIYFASNYMDGNGYGPGNRFLHFDYQHVSTFALSSIRAFPELISGRSFDYGKTTPADAGNEASAAVSAADNRCEVTLPVAPNIVIILRESAVIPAEIRGMNVANIAADRFRSFDGKTHRMRVETHGAGSAYTIFSVLTGISTEAFGGLKTLSVDFARKQKPFSLPMFTNKCGYQTMAVTTGIDGYVLAQPFYESIGFDSYSDLKSAIAENAGDSSDRAIYKSLLQRFKSADLEKPVFAYVDTTASHYPYIDPLRPEQNVREADAIPDPQIKEYVRRLLIAETDLDEFVAQYKLQMGPNQRPLVILDFGDHQPPFTTSLPGRPGFVNEDKDSDDEHLITWFRIRSWGTTLKPVPIDHPLVDAAFVGDWLVRALGLSVTGIYSQRSEFMDHCKSRYWQCDKGEYARRIHRVMRDSGLIHYQ